MNIKETMKMLCEQDDESKRQVAEFVRKFGERTVRCTGADDHGVSLQIEGTDIRFYATTGNLLESNTGKKVKDVKNRISARSVRDYVQ